MKPRTKDTVEGTFNEGNKKAKKFIAKISIKELTMPNGPTPESIPEPIGDPLLNPSAPVPIQDPPVVNPERRPWPGKILEAKNPGDDPTAVAEWPLNEKP